MGLLWSCPQNLRPDWNGLPRANPLAYWASSLVMKEKSFITLTPEDDGLEVVIEDQERAPLHADHHIKEHLLGGIGML